MAVLVLFIPKQMLAERYSSQWKKDRQVASLHKHTRVRVEPTEPRPSLLHQDRQGQDNGRVRYRFNRRRPDTKSLDPRAVIVATTVVVVAVAAAAGATAVADGAFDPCSSFTSVS